ncbi:MAG TPA: biotin/lipoate A/B protein ligase family protein [Gemmataceae bacterium]|nr:biotin/lipoate A/B protein ligase family protein [Gemmataceae bacterium]
MPMALLDRTLLTLNENLALDEALLLAAEADEGGEVVRFWEWSEHAIVLGAGGSIAIDVNEAACATDGVPVHRRASGGGTVLLGRGCLLFSLVLSYDRAAELRDVNGSYRWILGRVRDALRPVAAVDLAGISDLAVGGWKVSGNAQQRKARHILHHGSLLYAFDLGAVARYLNPPEREPPYRAGREHRAFVTNLPAYARTLKRHIAQAFGAESGEINQAVVDRVPILVAERYGRPDWVRRR